MGLTIRGMRGVALGILLLALGACSTVYRNHGYVPVDSDLEAIIVGVDTRDTLAETIGRPSVAGLMSEGAWYYVQSRYSHYAYRAPEEIERQVLAISFSPDGVVENIERFTLEDGQVVVLSRRVTETNIRGVGFIRQLLGNIGNFRAQDIVN